MGLGSVYSVMICVELCHLPAIVAEVNINLHGMITFTAQQAIAVFVLNHTIGLIVDVNWHIPTASRLLDARGVITEVPHHPTPPFISP